MDIRIDRQFSMAQKVRDFCRAHPSTAPGYVETVARLEERIARAEALAAQRVAGHRGAGAAAAVKARLRQTLRDDHLRHLVRIARAANGGGREVRSQFRLPKANADTTSFLTAARVLAREAAEVREIFIRDGMPENFLDNLNEAIERFAASLHRRGLETALHVGARADLKATLHEVMTIVRRLDGINQFRFRNDPDLLAGWNAVRAVSWPGNWKRRVARAVTPSEAPGSQH